MTKYVLNLSAKKAFLIIFLLPWIIWMIGSIMVITGTSRTITLFGICMSLVPIWGFLIWVCSIVKGFNKDRTLLSAMFYVCVLFLALQPILSFFYVDKIWQIEYGQPSIKGVVNSAFILYIILFSAKTLHSREVMGKGNTFDFFKISFFILLYPLGIFKLQPRINQFIGKAEEQSL